jgi:hypothetical protein
MLLFTLLDDIIDSALTTESFLQYGILGAFALLMILIIKYQDTTNKAQQEKVLETYKSVNDSFKSELNDLKKEKEAVYADFLLYLKTTEEKLLAIISENTNAFKLIVASNENISKAINGLVESISKRDETSKELNDNLIKLVNKNK